MEQQVANIKDLFRHRFDSEPRVFRAPGRINLIGEHTDYNDGFVLPAAIDLQTLAACSPRDDRRFSVWAADVREEHEFDLDQAKSQKYGTWVDYVEGMIRTLDSNSTIERGANIVFSSTVPIGAGMSSSAALEVAIGYSVLALNDAEIDRLALAKVGQRAEHEFVGTRSGIMDQFASVNGRSGHAMLLDCRSLSANYIALDLTGYTFVICDSGVHHQLASSEYNRRREECEEAVELLQQWYPQITHLRDVSIEEFDAHSTALPPTVSRRTRHVITENQRTLSAASFLSEGNFSAFGRLMFESHRSLRDDFEVSCAELDLLVASAASIEGVLGARVMGGGFGGSTINLVSNEAVEAFRKAVSKEYRPAFEREPIFYVVRSADGASEVL